MTVWEGFFVGLGRSALQHRRRSDATETKARNRIVKNKERARRGARMMDKLRTESLPYTPAVMIWLSRELCKKATEISQEDVQTLLS